MIRRTTILCAALAFAAALAVPAHAATFPTNAHAFLVEGPHEEVLAQRTANREVPIASLTKLMTIFIALHHLHLGQLVTVPYSVTTVGESTAGLRAGEEVSVRDLLGAALVPSANDAADTLAYAASNGESFAQFAEDMNARARALELRHTHFDRPDGLSNGDEASARDITRLARMLMRRPAIRSIVRERSVTIEGRTLPSRNNLLSSYPGTMGVKTGHTDAAGWCEVAAAQRNGVVVYVTVLGAPTESARDADLAALLDFGLSRYRPAVVADPHRVYARVPAGFGRAAVNLVAPRRIVRPLRTGRPIVERVVAPGALSLPVRRGRRLGRVVVYQDGRVVGRSPLVAARSESRPGTFGRVGWYLGETAHKLWSWL